jgi:hypothetical protein
MTRLYNDPSHFADEAIDGFVAARISCRGRVVPARTLKSLGTLDAGVCLSAWWHSLALAHNGP